MFCMWAPPAHCAASMHLITLEHSETTAPGMLQLTCLLVICSQSQDLEDLDVADVAAISRVANEVRKYQVSTGLVSSRSNKEQSQSQHAISGGHTGSSCQITRRGLCGTRGADCARPHSAC